MRYLIIILMVCFLIIGYRVGEWTTKHRAYIYASENSMPYGEFFRKVRHTDSPITDVYLKNWGIFIETEDGNKDIKPLDIKYRGDK